MTRQRGARRRSFGGLVCVTALCCAITSCADRSPPAAWPEPEPPSFARPVESAAPPDHNEQAPAADSVAPEDSAAAPVSAPDAPAEDPEPDLPPQANR